MMEDFSAFTKPISNFEEQTISISKYSNFEGGIKNLFEASFYRETCLALEKQNSTLLNVTLDKLIKAIAPIK